MSAGTNALSPRTFAAGDVVLSCEPWVWSFQYEYRFHKRRCAQCFQEADCLRACSGCNLYRYCNTQCQTMNWKKEHKRECVMLRGIQANILKYDRSFDHDCELGGCSKYGCCTVEILVAKICNKILKGTKEELAGYPGKKSVAEVLDLLPYDGTYEKDLDLSDRTMRKLCWTAQMERIPGFVGLVRKICYNVLPIGDAWGKQETEMIGIFPQASHRDMTPVCWDINVTMDLQGRNLVVRATEAITNYTGLKDLRQNELLSSGNTYILPLMRRREEFYRHYRRPCACRGCTEEYNAEINPLKCVTKGCMERIPSDARAVEPCPQCGAINADRLRQLKQLMARYEKLQMQTPAGAAEMDDLFLQLESLDILHKDAHFRLIGVPGGTEYTDMGRYAEAWDRLSSLIPCVRAVYPKYHIGRARWLKQVGELPAQWFEHWFLNLIEEERDKFLTEVLPTASEYLLEAQGIYKLISGEGAMWDIRITEILRLYGVLKFMP